MCKEEMGGAHVERKRVLDKSRLLSKCCEFFCDALPCCLWVSNGPFSFIKIQCPLPSVRTDNVSFHVQYSELQMKG